MRPVGIAHPEHMVNQARAAAALDPGGFFADQFENLANYRAHLETGAGLGITPCPGAILNLPVLAKIKSD